MEGGELRISSLASVICMIRGGLKWRKSNMKLKICGEK